MKKPLAALLVACILTFPVVAIAADAKPQQTQVTQSAPDVAKFDKQMAEAQKNMQLMQEQMNKINQTQDPQERRKLMQEHWSSMQKTMPMMRSMMGYMGCPMMGGMMNGHMMMDGDDNMMGWNDMDGYYSNLTPEQTKQRQYMMDRYMGMQNMMMDNMMMHQNWMMQPNQ